MNVNIFERLHWNKGNIMETAGIIQERSHLLFNKVKPILIPVYCSHLGHHHNQLDNTQSLS